MPNMEDFYETNSVSKGRDSYSCEYCGGNIKKGTPSDVHKFYPEFQGYRTHPKCSDKFLAQESCSECGENFEPKELTMVAGKKFCSDCKTDAEEEARKKAEAKSVKAKLEEEKFKKADPLRYASLQIKKEIGL